MLALVKEKKQPTIREMLAMYKELRKLVPQIMRQASATGVFDHRVVIDLCVASKNLAQDYL